MVRRNTAPEALDGGGGARISFEVARIHVEHLWPSLFMPARERWGTSDGCIPGRVVWAYWHATHLVRARIALDTSHGAGLAFSKDEGLDRPRQDAFDRAFPSDRTVTRGE